MTACQACGSRPPPAYVQYNVRLPPVGLGADTSAFSGDELTLLVVRNGGGSWSAADDAAVGLGLRWHVGWGDRLFSETPSLGPAKASSALGDPRIRLVTFARPAGSPAQIIADRTYVGIPDSMPYVDSKYTTDQASVTVITTESCPHVAWFARPGFSGPVTSFEFGFSEAMDPASFHSDSFKLLLPDGTEYPSKGVRFESRTNADGTTEGVLVAQIDPPSLSDQYLPGWRAIVRNVAGLTGVPLAGRFQGVDLNVVPDAGSYAPPYDCGASDFVSTLPLGLSLSNGKKYLAPVAHEH
jgi:hypothetical protein